MVPREGLRSLRATLHGEFSPMLKCEVWHAVADAKDILCLDCLETGCVRSSAGLSAPTICCLARSARTASCCCELLPDPEALAAYLAESRAARAAFALFDEWVEERIESDFNDWRTAVFTAASCRVHGAPTHVVDTAFGGLLAATVADGPMPSWADIDRAREIFDVAGPEAAAAFLRSTIPTEKETKTMNTTSLRTHDFAIFELYCLAIALGAEPTWDELRAGQGSPRRARPRSGEGFPRGLRPKSGARL